MIFSAPTWTILLPMQNMLDKRKFRLRCLLTVCAAHPVGYASPAEESNGRLAHFFEFELARKNS
jgi:hypothetical protein